MLSNIAVISSGRHIGYLMNNIYIKSRYFRYIMNIPLSVTDTVFGNEALNGVVVDGVFYKDIMSCDISELSGLNTKRFIFKECDSSCSHKYEIYDTMKYVGDMILSADLYNSMSFDILFIEVLYKGIGIGTEIINQLRTYGVEIHGLSLDRAVGFWKKNGAEFIKNSRFIIRRRV